MSLVWMAFVAVLIAVEKLLPWKALANRGIAVLLIALGLAVALVPERVPGLTAPDSPEVMRAMEAMGMQPTEMHSSRTSDSMGEAVAPSGGMPGLTSP
jgi:hypothetical protein